MAHPRFEVSLERVGGVELPAAHRGALTVIGADHVTAVCTLAEFLAIIASLASRPYRTTR
jgi:hypothetical protein